MLRPFFYALFIVATTLIAGAQASSHRQGPNGLEGWLVRKTVETLENQGPLPSSMVLARKGKVVRRLTADHDGGPFYWNLIFLSDKQVAFESGPLHFVLTCTRMDIETGKRLETYDCFAEPLASDAPQWVKKLKATPQL